MVISRKDCMSRFWGRTMADITVKSGTHQLQVYLIKGDQRQVVLSIGQMPYSFLELDPLCASDQTLLRKGYLPMT